MSSLRQNLVMPYFQTARSIWLQLLRMTFSHQSACVLKHAQILPCRFSLHCNALMLQSVVIKVKRIIHSAVDKAEEREEEMRV